MHKLQPKTRKVFELQDRGHHYTVIYHRDAQNPYRLYANWYDNGEHRKLLAKYADLKSCLCFIIPII